MRHLILCFLLLGCTDAFQEAKTANTIDAFEKYLAENPTSARAYEAKVALENLYVGAARTSKDLKDYDVYLKKFKKSTVVKSTYTKMVEEREETAWSQALEAHDPGVYEAFIKKYAKKSQRRSRIAKQYIKVSAYESNLVMEPIEQEQVNMANDPDGPLNGWKFSTTVTNKGDKDITWLQVRISFLDADGNTADADEKSMDTVIIGPLIGREWATPEYRKPPFKPGQTRTWEYMTGDTPPDWGKRIKVQYVQIKFKNEDD